jgi:hypothetical protein
MRAFSVTLLAVAASCGISLGTANAQDTRILGQWSSGTFDGLTSVIRRECTAVAVTERRIRLTLVPGSSKVEGEWVRWSRNMWINTDNGSCRWVPEATQFEPLWSGSWVYLLTGVFDKAGSTLRIHGEFVKCDGNACSRWQAATEMTKPFDTELRLVGGKLFDMNGHTDPSEGVEFVRVSDHAEEVEEANSVLEGYLKMMDAGDVDHFYDAASAESFRKDTTRQQFRAAVSEFQSRVGKPRSRHNLNTLYIVYAPIFSKAPGQYVFLYNGVETTKNLRGGEFILLTKESSEWKLAWISTGS